MQKRTLGKTGLEVSIIGFGGIKLPQIDGKAATKLLNRAIDDGINFLDSARGYGDSEEKIGNALSGRRGEFYLCSKAMAYDRAEMAASIDASLKACKTDHFDLYLIHNLRRPADFDLAVSEDGALAALEEARTAGKVRHIGFSSHRIKETMVKAIETGRFEAAMLSYNMLNDELLDEDIIPLARGKGLGVIAMKPLAGGVLGAPPLGLKLPGSAFGISAREALRFVVSHPAVTLAIPGMMRLQELAENVEVGKGLPGLSPEELARLSEAAEALGRDFCRSCHYCMPCEQGIRIPVLMRHLAYCKMYGLEKWARGRYRMVETKADACVRCGKCEEKCPYNLPIMDRLAEVHALLG
ncbi:MAG: aldo/keto reductase [Kiritimatiellae bacterium]|nr:aldo/keto reductase [Kiritimatiellia bacterium]